MLHRSFTRDIPRRSPPLLLTLVPSDNLPRSLPSTLPPPDSLSALPYRLRAPSLPSFAANSTRLAASLKGIGLTVYPGEGGYFLWVDVTPVGMTGMEFVRWLSTEAKVIAMPGALFFGTKEAKEADKFVRFAVCKDAETVARACAAIDAVKGKVKQ